MRRFNKKTLYYRICQFAFTIALIVFSIGVIGVDAHFDSSVHPPFYSSLFSYQTALLEILLSIIIVSLCAYVYEEETKRYRENRLTPEQIRDILEKEDFKKIQSEVKSFRN